ncbi:LysR family transcriptional regulator [Klebsiella pneumoniae]|uniref:LysR family transcriptional regulator n=1 Tax=Klebsiella pneumoniae TaxID=573 RepID=A0A927HMN2_KLEPN|nr:LysR family transcriptional regulator [Klebsiella pneumoniae]
MACGSCTAPPAGSSSPEDGMVYYERAKDLLSNLDELDGMFQHDPASISGRLRVDMPVGFAKKW